jgi:hypothetical protein
MGNDSEHRHGPKLNRTAVGMGPGFTLVFDGGPETRGVAWEDFLHAAEPVHLAPGVFQPTGPELPGSARTQGQLSCRLLTLFGHLRQTDLRPVLAESGLAAVGARTARADLSRSPCWAVRRQCRARLILAEAEVSRRGRPRHG